MSLRVPVLALSIWLTALPVSAARLNLRECIQQALTASNSLRGVGRDQALATEQRAQAFSGYLPRVDLSAGYTFLREPQAFIMGNMAIENEERDFPNAGIAITQTITDFGRTSARISRADAQTRSAAAYYRAASADLTLQVIEAYFGILEGEKLLQAADDEVAQMADHLKVATSLYEQGVVTRNDLLQASVRLASSKQRKLSLANLLDNRWAGLNYVMVRPLDARDQLDEQPLSAISEQIPSERSLPERPEIVASKEQVNAAESALKETSSNFFPELFTRLSADYLENRHVREQVMYSAVFGIRFNLFDGLATTAQRKQAVVRLQQQEDRLRDMEERLRLELVQATNDVVVAKERISVTEQAISQSEENLRINRDRYQEQVGTATEVLDAQTLLTQTKTDYYRAIYDYQVATARLQRAKGAL